MAADRRVSVFLSAWFLGLQAIAWGSVIACSQEPTPRTYHIHGYETVISALMYSPDGTSLGVWTGSRFCAPIPPELTVLDSASLAVRWQKTGFDADRFGFTADGRRLLVTKTYSAPLNVQAFDTRTGHRLQKNEPTAIPIWYNDRLPRFSPDGELAAVLKSSSWSDSRVVVRDVNTGRCIKTLRPEYFGPLQFTADGFYLVSCGIAVGEQEGVGVTFWDTQTWRQRSYALPNDSRGFWGRMAVSQDGRYIAVCCENQLELRDLRSGRLVRIIERKGLREQIPDWLQARVPFLQPSRNWHVTDLAFSPDGHTLAVVDWSGEIRFWQIP